MLTHEIDAADLDFSLDAMTAPVPTGHLRSASRPARYAVVVYGRRIATLPTFERAAERARQVGGSVEVV